MNIKSLGSKIYSTPRTLLFFYAVVILLLSTVIFSFGFVLNIPALLITATMILLLWFVVIFISLLPQTDVVLVNHAAQLKRGAQIIFVSFTVIGVLVGITVGIIIPHVIQNKNTSQDLRQLLTGVQRDYGYNDGTILSKQAVENLLHGKNPYANANIIQALIDFNGSYDRVTPLRVGKFYDVFPYPSQSQLTDLWYQAVLTPSQIPPEIESRVCYPAGSFLLPAPFVFIGIGDIRIIYAIFLLAGLIYAAWVIPKKKRLLFIAVAFISLELWNSLFSGGEMGNLCFPFLMVAWLALNRNLWLSVICMGIAVATKQTAWFFVPFYLILLAKTYGLQKIVYRHRADSRDFCRYQSAICHRQLANLVQFNSIADDRPDVSQRSGSDYAGYQRHRQAPFIPAVHGFGSIIIHHCHHLVFQILPQISANRADSGSRPAVFCLAQPVPLFLLRRPDFAGLYSGE